MIFFCKPVQERAEADTLDYSFDGNAEALAGSAHERAPLDLSGQILRESIQAFPAAGC